MKSEQKIIQALKHAEYYSKTDDNFRLVVDLLNEFLVDNKTPQKKGSFNIYNFVEKDGLRPVLNGVYHDRESEFAVATDGHILVTSKADYNPEFAGKVVDKYGKVIEGKYPEFKALLESYKKDSELYEIDTSSVKKIIAIFKTKKACSKEYKYATPIVAIGENAYNALQLQSFLTISDKCYCAPNKPLWWQDDNFQVLLMNVYAPEIPNKIGIRSGDSREIEVIE